MSNRKTIPEKTKKRTFQESNSKCPFCGESDVDCLEIHHIYPVSNGGGNELENLILVCANCHSSITNGSITTSEVLSMKYKLLKGKEERGRDKEEKRGANILKLHNTSNTGIIANNFSYTSQSKSTPKVQPPTGALASDLEKRNYVKYLIDRYNEFKKADKNLGNFKYSIIYQAIKREFKADWKFVPLTKFDELSKYLQMRIDKTIVGRANKSKGRKSYSNFQEFLYKHNK